MHEGMHYPLLLGLPRTIARIELVHGLNGEFGQPAREGAASARASEAPRETMAATMAGGSRKLKYEKMLEKKRHQRELEAVWKSNRRRPTPSTRRRPRD